MARGAVAAGHPLTGEAAAEMLRLGGNAFDAVLAGLCAACVAEPVLCSLGGGGFLMAWEAERGRAEVTDFFAQTPRQKRPAAELDFFPILADFGTAQQEFHIGLGAIATPGVVRGLFDIHRRLGSLPMGEIVAPAVALAREGVRLDALQAYIFSIVAPIYTATPEAQAIYGRGRPPGELLGEGDVLLQPELADTLEALAREGDALFYEGDIAAAIAAQCADGGQLTADDLRHYRAVRRAPLEVNYRAARFLTNPPPASGGILIAFALDLLSAVRLGEWPAGGHGRLRLLAEVMAETNRARVEAHARGDGLAGTALLSPALLARYRAEIQGRAAGLRGTTHLSVADRHGNLAALTVSNGEGCGRMVPGTGIMLNNMLGEEDLNPDGFHRWRPDERLTSMMAPSLLTWPDGRRVALGSGGSNRIRSAILQVVSHLVDDGLPLPEAVAAPRIHFERGRLSVEGGFRPEVVAALEADYPQHQVWPGRNLFFGGVHAVQYADGQFAGAGDPRRGGVFLPVA